MNTSGSSRSGSRQGSDTQIPSWRSIARHFWNTMGSDTVCDQDGKVEIEVLEDNVNNEITVVILKRIRRQCPFSAGTSNTLVLRVLSELSGSVTHLSKLTKRRLQYMLRHWIRVDFIWSDPFVWCRLASASNPRSGLSRGPSIDLFHSPLTLALGGLFPPRLSLSLLPPPAH